MEKRWNILPFDPDATNRLQETLRINPTLCRILTQRKITDFNSARDFFRPDLAKLHDPWLMKDMRKAVDRIQQAKSQDEKILVFGDYDVDGTTAVASFYGFLKATISPDNLDFYIPHRYREGYGISKMGIDYAKANGFTLIISLDCGIKSADLIAYASTLAIDFIVCDHHLPDKIIPAAVAILNPKQVDCPYPYKELCGCGVGFKLMQALSQEWNLPPERYLVYLDLLATAIAADIVPMTGENRILAFHGLIKINADPCPGIKAIMELAGKSTAYSITHVVFQIAPRVNAAGRMDDARKAVELFIEQDYKQALQQAMALHSDNSDRKEVDEQITLEGLEIIRTNPELLRKKTTVLYQEHWHKGVVGIVASRLIEHHFRPTIVLTKSGDVIAGSARSVPGFNLYEAIHACREHLLGYGGHFAAAGLSLLPENLEAFTQAFEAVVAHTIDPKLLIPEIIVDAPLSLQELTPRFYDILLQMEPYGPENMRPVFIIQQVTNSGYSRILKEKHLRVDVIQNNHRISGIGFNLADRFPIVQSGQPFDIACTIDENEWNGNKSLQLKVIDIRPALA